MAIGGALHCSRSCCAEFLQYESESMSGMNDVVVKQALSFRLSAEVTSLITPVTVPPKRQNEVTQWTCCDEHAILLK